MPIKITNLNEGTGNLILGIGKITEEEFVVELKKTSAARRGKFQEIQIFAD